MASEPSSTSVISDNSERKSSQYKFIFIGGGNMASALIEGAVKSGFASKESIIVSVRSAQSVEKWKAKGYTNVYTDNEKMLEENKGCIVVLAIKPQKRHEVYSQVGEKLKYATFVVSILAGIKLDTLKGELEKCSFNGPIARLMPNVCSSIGRGTSVLSHTPDALDLQIEAVRGLAESVGICITVDDSTFNASGSIAGCTPAWIYIVIEALADGGVLSGCSRADAMKLAAHSVMGAAQMVLETGEHPGVLKDKVCSSAGTTITGLRELEKAGVRSAFIECVKSSVDRANSM